MQFRAKFPLDLPIVIEPEGDVFVSSCPALDVFSQGVDEQEARLKLGEALSAFLSSCLERGVLEQVLLEAGLTPAPG